MSVCSTVIVTVSTVVVVLVVVSFPGVLARPVTAPSVVMPTLSLIKLCNNEQQKISVIN